MPILPTYLSSAVHLLVFLPTYRYVSILSVGPLIYLPTSGSINRSIHLSIHPLTNLSTKPFIGVSSNHFLITFLHLIFFVHPPPLIPSPCHLTPSPQLSSRPRAHTIKPEDFIQGDQKVKPGCSRAIHGLPIKRPPEQTTSHSIFRPRQVEQNE